MSYTISYIASIDFGKSKAPGSWSRLDAYSGFEIQHKMRIIREMIICLTKRASVLPLSITPQSQQKWYYYYHLAKLSSSFSQLPNQNPLPQQTLHLSAVGAMIPQKGETSGTNSPLHLLPSTLPPPPD